MIAHARLLPGKGHGSGASEYTVSKDNWEKSIIFWNYLTSGNCRRILGGEMIGTYINFPFRIES